MAGIGFALSRLSARQSLSASVVALGVSAVVSVGPWMFTVMSVAALYYLAAEHLPLPVLYEFRTALIYNFAITLVASAPVAMLATRLLADQIYAKDVRAASGVLVAGMALTLLSQAPIVVCLYGFYADMSPEMRAACAMNYFLVAALWVASVFLTALKDYGSVTGAFAAGLAIAFGAAYALTDFGAPGLMLGFSAGLAVALYLIVARAFAEFPGTMGGWSQLVRYMRRYPDVALSGLIYNAAIWIDKWVMWSAPEAVWPPSGLVTFPAYDGAMFFAQLTLIPAFALFVLSVETAFFASYRRFYTTIEAHGSWSKIDAAHRAMMADMAEAARRLIALQVCVAMLAILLSPGIAMALGIHGQQMGIFRFGVLGSLFHALFLFASIALAYFDLRRHVLIAQTIFLASNAAGAAVTLNLGFAWYGYGYAAAAAISFGWVATVLMIEARRLPYLTFIVHNPALRPAGRKS